MKDWDVDGSEAAELYRRRMIPFYLLENEANQYPVYIDNSDLKLNSTNKKCKQYKIEKIVINYKGKKAGPQNRLN